MNKITRLAAAFVLSGLLLAAPAAQAAPALLGASANFELEVNEMELEITADDPKPIFTPAGRATTTSSSG